MTSSISVPEMPVRLTSSAMTAAARVSGAMSFNIPPKRPTGVRRGSQITASGIDFFFRNKRCAVSACSSVTCSGRR